MTLKLMRALALWSGCMALMVISVLPLSLVAQALSVVGALMLVAGGWLLAGRGSSRLGGSPMLDEFRALPGSEYRLPVVLVCGEGTAALFAADADAGVDTAEQIAVRTTASGCYVSVPNIERLPGLVAALLAARSQWRAQMSVMCVVNPSQHTDSSELDGQLRALTHQLSVVRKRALTLPLWVVSYQQASQDTRDVCGTGFTREEAGSSDPSVWFSWENGRPSARVRSNGTCASVEDWQRQDRAALTHRMHIAVQMNTHGAWLEQFVAPHFTRLGRRSARVPVAYAICRVPRLPEQAPGSVWQHWIQAKTALVPTHLTGSTVGVLPVPDCLLELLPRHTGNTAARRASVIGIWLTAFAAVIAMSSSARQNTLLIRQVGDDLRRYASINETAREDQQAVALREAALTVLHDDARRLDDYYRYGEPRSLGLGLYRAEQLRIRVWHAIGRYQPPTETVQAAGPVRLDTLSLFNIGSAELKPESTEVLINALVGIKARPGWLIVVTGHTDATGSAEQNLRLSRDRAASVRDWMQRMGVSPGLWKGLSPTLWQFYAEQLKANPQWRIEADNALVAQARQVLLVQLGQRNGEASLYQQVLEAAATHAPDLGVEQMVDDKEAWPLFFTEARVPGVFTRQAWEGQVRQAIDDIVAARREQIDWVLSDRESRSVADASPEQLRARLTERYFHDYSGAWLEFLNSVQWRRADSLADVIDQLTLMSDVRQSPLIAFMNTLAWQGQAGHRSQGLKDSLMQSAQKLMGSERPLQVPAISQQLDTPAGPLDPTFGPLLGLLGKDPEGKGGDDDLSLQAFLTRVTRVRLKLQQVSHAADPQGMTQAMAQTVFQGKNIDLTDTRAYGELLAASLGEEWDGVAHALFVQPLDQAWGKVLEPSAIALNRQWQQAVVDEWDKAFLGRYPFAATGSDASLTMLGKMIRADSGRIEQFLQRELTGVLRKDGGRWGVDPAHGQGLLINPKFLAAVNQLSHLADVLYTDGGMGINFELQGKAVRDVVQTTFVLNGARHQYFNQKESWQRFAWPGSSDYPGASLTWTSVRSGERLYGDFQGAWGLIRLLDAATVTALDDSDSRYRISVPAPDGLDLTWHMRTELGAGPMSLLALRNFKLPRQIFLNSIASAQTASRAEVME